MVTVCPHQHGLGIYLLLCQAGQSIGNFEQLFTRQAEQWGQSTASLKVLGPMQNQTHSICDPIGEPDDLNLTSWPLPVRIQGQHQPQRGRLRISMVI